MPILPGRGPQMSVRNSTPGNSAMSSGRKNQAWAPMPGISCLLWIIFLLIDHGVPITRLMASGALKAVPLEMASDHPVEIAMRHQRRHPILARLGDQDVGRLGGAPARFARILDAGMKTRMPKNRS